MPPHVDAPPPVSLSPVKFGTDGWRGIIADDFTYANVRIAASAIANYILAHEDPAAGVCIGWDTRFASQSFARVVAEVMSSAGIPVALASGITPTPALSWQVRERKAAGGVMITSSHNPAEWNGVKYKASYGGSGRPAIIASIETYLGKSLPAATPAPIDLVDFNPAYIATLERFIDLPAIRASGYRFLVDTMYGAGRGVVSGIFERAGIPCVAIRDEVNPAFPGINPEPILPHIAESQRAVVAEHCDAGLITDGDADRIGAVDEHGNVVDAHKIYAILLRWLLTRHPDWTGDITRAFNTTKMLDRIAAKYGRALHEHGIGFKYVCDFMLERDILIGGEESGGIGIARHLPERDGLLNSLLLANVMANEKKTLGQLVAQLQDEFGEHQYGRVDMHITEPVKQDAIVRARAGLTTFAGFKVLRTETLDGIKLFLEVPDCSARRDAAETWLLLRASGTEPLLRVYCESCSTASVDRILAAAQKFVLQESGTE